MFVHIYVYMYIHISVNRSYRAPSTLALTFNRLFTAGLPESLRSNSDRLPLSSVNNELNQRPLRMLFLSLSFLRRA